MLRNWSKLGKDELIYLSKLIIIEKLLGDIAHQFNNQLGGIEDCSRGALEDGTPEVMQKTLELILPVSEKACSLTRIVTDFARAKSTGKQELDIGEALEKALALRKQGFQKRGIQVTRAFAELPRVQLNAGKTLQLLLTMLMEIEEVMKNGGLLTASLSPCAEAGEIEISFRHDQDARSERREPALALRAAEKILEEQGGRLHLEGDETGGAYALRLPLEEAPPQSARAGRRRTASKRREL